MANRYFLACVVFKSVVNKKLQFLFVLLSNLSVFNCQIINDIECETHIIKNQTSIPIPKEWIDLIAQLIGIRKKTFKNSKKFIMTITDNTTSVT